MVKTFRFLLLPFSIIYGSITFLRNKLFDIGWLPSHRFPFAVIVVGNLQTGGTGKSPMVKYIASLLCNEFACAILSRGYKRKTTGFRLASKTDSALTIGDEPYDYFTHLGNKLSIAVCENRVAGISQLQKKKAHSVIICDDAFQHRQLKSDFNILLTNYDQLYADDYLLPAGNLREPLSGATRAQVVVVSKCPENITLEDKKIVSSKLKLNNEQRLFFSFIRYTGLVCPFNQTMFEMSNAGNYEVLLFCGIANPALLIEYLRKHFARVEIISFADHHPFSVYDLIEINSKFNTLATRNKILVTTTKDIAKIDLSALPFENEKLFVQNMTVGFAENEKLEFDNIILKYARQNKTNS